MTDKVSTHIETELAKFTITDAAISQMKKEYMPLNINGIDDKEGYAIVHAARMVVKGKRVEVEKTRKVLKEDTLIFGRAVDGEAKRITALLGSIESYLLGQQAAVDKEKARIKEEEAELIRAEEERVKQAEIDRIAKEEEAARLAREEAMAAEEARLEAERIRQEKVEAEQRKKEVALKAAQEKVEAEKRAIVEAKQKEADEKKRLAELEKAKKEAAEAARIEAEQKAKRDAEEKVNAELRAKAEAEREEALRPDREKLIALSAAIISFPLPMLKDVDARNIINGVEIRLQDTVTFIGESLKQMGGEA